MHLRDSQECPFLGQKLQVSSGCLCGGAGCAFHTIFSHKLDPSVGCGNLCSGLNVRRILACADPGSSNLLPKFAARAHTQDCLSQRVTRCDHRTQEQDPRVLVCRAQGQSLPFSAVACAVPASACPSSQGVRAIYGSVSRTWLERCGVTPRRQLTRTVTVRTRCCSSSAATRC